MRRHKWRKQQEKKQQGKRITAPPMTLRHCRLCDEPTWFKYTPHVGHSACTKCGGRVGRSVD